MKKSIFLFILIYAFFLNSCSLKYGMPEYDESSVPEFAFTDVNFNRYENGKISLTLNAEKMEQYKDGKSLYAQNLEFQLLDEENTVSTQGKCNLLAANTDSEEYILYDEIEIQNTKENLTLQADTLKWNGKTEQLTSSRNDNVSIKKDDTFIQGAGFSASGISRQFNFTGAVIGQAADEQSSENSLNSAENSTINATQSQINNIE